MKIKKVKIGIFASSPSLKERILEELLDIEFVRKIYRDTASLEKVVTRAQRQGCEVVVGGGVTQRIAGAIGLKFV